MQEMNGFDEQYFFWLQIVHYHIKTVKICTTQP